MSRRDTIIVAVLINAGLLVLLFTTALKPSKEGEQAAPTLATTVQTLEPVLQEPLVLSPKDPAPAGDEVDRVLQQYGQYTNQPVATQEPPAVSSFADELRGAAPVVQAEPTKEMNIIEVKVKKGDMLEKLARAHKTTVSEIMRLNHLTSANLKIGQLLRIPAHSGTKISTPAASTDAKYYVVKQGDNAWTIAVKHQLKLEELLQLNHLDKEKARKLKAGDRLRVR